MKTLLLVLTVLTSFSALADNITIEDKHSRLVKYPSGIAVVVNPKVKVLGKWRDIDINSQENGICKLFAGPQYVTTNESSDEGSGCFAHDQVIIDNDGKVFGLIKAGCASGVQKSTRQVSSIECYVRNGTDGDAPRADIPAADYAIRTN